MTRKSGFIIRCATPDCDWGYPMPSSSDPDWQIYFEKCKRSFREHCIERHGLDRNEPAHVWLDIEHWMMELTKE